MSEVPEGVNLPTLTRKPPRPTVTLTLTRDGENGVEVLLGRRAESMRAFPGYWAFPGGGVSGTDREGELYVQNSTAVSTASIVAVVREMTEELGVVPNGNMVSAIDVELRKRILNDKHAFVDALKAASIQLDTRFCDTYQAVLRLRLDRFSLKTRFFIFISVNKTSNRQPNIKPNLRLLNG